MSAIDKVVALALERAKGANPTLTDDQAYRSLVLFLESGINSNVGQTAQVKDRI